MASGKEPIKERRIGLTLVFDSKAEKQVYEQFLSKEGRKPAAYILHLLKKELEETEGLGMRRQGVSGAFVRMLR